MSANFIEELVTEYYKLRGYLVSTNYWFSIVTERTRNQRGKEQTYFARSWSDIDVIAVGEKEIIIVQVKAIVNEKDVVEGVKTFFQRADKFLKDGVAPDQKESIAWWLKGREIKRVLVYEYSSPPKYLELLKEAGIEVHSFTSYFNQIVEYIEKKEGVKEESALMRMLHYMNVNKRIVPASE